MMFVECEDRNENSDVRVEAARDNRALSAKGLSLVDYNGTSSAVSDGSSKKEQRTSMDPGVRCPVAAFEPTSSR